MYQSKLYSRMRCRLFSQGSSRAKEFVSITVRKRSMITSIRSLTSSNWNSQYVHIKKPTKKKLLLKTAPRFRWKDRRQCRRGIRWILTSTPGIGQKCNGLPQRRSWQGQAARRSSPWFHPPRSRRIFSVFKSTIRLVQRLSPRDAKKCKAIILQD